MNVFNAIAFVIGFTLMSVVYNADASPVAEYEHNGWEIWVHNNKTISIVKDDDSLRFDYSYSSGSPRFFYVSFNEATRDDMVIVNGKPVKVEKHGSLFSRRYKVSTEEGRKAVIKQIASSRYLKVDDRSISLSGVDSALEFSLNLINEAI